MLKAIIVDDEKQLRITLRKDLETFCEGVMITGEGDSVKSAIQLIDKLLPDVVFLDIHLGDGSGFTVLEKCTFKNFKTIFITAYDEYAIKAFKTNAVDYLLKPYSKEELVDAVAKVSDLQKNAATPTPDKFAVLSPDQKIAIQTSEGIGLYPVNDIIYCQSNGNYCNIHFSNKKKLLSGKTLKEYEAILEPYGFVRVHHSYLVSFSQINKYSNKDGGHLIMSNGSTIPVSQRKKTSVLGLIEKYMK